MQRVENYDKNMCSARQPRCRNQKSQGGWFAIHESEAPSENDKTIERLLLVALVSL